MVEVRNVQARRLAGLGVFPKLAEFQSLGEFVVDEARQFLADDIVRFDVEHLAHGFVGGDEMPVEVVFRNAKRGPDRVGAPLVRDRA